ncbi:MAG: hypothetical protein NTV01_08465 [Bacteroidia bacterium]|nr:hypothetical protein [Bacteroidia bacterium]
MVLDWYTVTVKALMGLWEAFLMFIPALLGAIIVLIIGWFISIGIGKLITEVLKKLKFNQVFEKGSWKTALEKAEIKVDAAGFIGAIIKWILFIVFMMAAVEILGLGAFASFLKGVLAYLPNVVVAALIFVATVILVDIVEKITRAGVEGIKVGYGKVISSVVKWSVWIFSILAILHQLGIARPFMETLFTGLVAILVLSFGLSFGLGGKEVAAELLRDFKKKMEE